MSESSASGVLAPPETGQFIPVVLREPRRVLVDVETEDDGMWWTARTRSLGLIGHGLTKRRALANLRRMVFERAQGEAARRNPASLFQVPAISTPHGGRDVQVLQVVVEQPYEVTCACDEWPEIAPTLVWKESEISPDLRDRPSLVDVEGELVEVFYCPHCGGAVPQVVSVEEVTTREEVAR